MAAPKLVNGQRLALLTWLAADYDTSLIIKWFRDRNWPALDRDDVFYYRKRFRQQIEAVRAERHTNALTSGLALKEERIERLKHHADELEAIKWLPDEKGRLWNEKAWRETLADIAAEMGDRKQPVVHSGEVKHEHGVDDDAARMLADLIARGIASPTQAGD